MVTNICSICKNVRTFACKADMIRRSKLGICGKCRIENKGKIKVFSSKGHKSATESGYILIRKPEHPHAKKNGYVLEHRLVMEKYLERFLEPYEVIHHINHDKHDNRIENLSITNNKEHCSIYHQKGKKCSICDRKHLAKGYCVKHYWKMIMKPNKVWRKYIK